MLGLTACFLGLQWLLVLYVDLTPASVAGLQLGAFLGLASLAIEIECLARAFRASWRDPSQVTFMSFFLRLATVGPLTLLFAKEGSAIGSEPFALSYCSTFFVYMCWLTWRMATAPTSFEGGARRFSEREWPRAKRALEPKKETSSKSWRKDWL